jgi:hypothetical protein
MQEVDGCHRSPLGIHKLCRVWLIDTGILSKQGL